ncbi:membrane protein [Thermogladius calderae 1633]|uniref:Membrane protein n=1 Tax=Thermogladius calderae (strain DSM 22663 / VKM B-2946 / 1633) TaxID=1184251 RepID=I3TDM3_THEC1|nr:DUF1616 domain-containing protein [Thermogladius calderae]AFK50861.1 membrane protein [Thermogladius calderae 1633]
MSNKETLEDYVAKKRTGIKSVLEAYREWARGDIELRDPHPPRSFLEVVVRLDYSLWFWTLISVEAITLLLVAVSSTSPILTFARYLFGSLFVLFLPGYSLIRALYQSRELSPIEELALSIGLSLAIVPLVGLVLNYTPFGIRLTPVLTSLALLTTALSLLGLYRKYSEIVEVVYGS